VSTQDLKFWDWQLFEHFTWDNGATLLAALFAVTGVVLGFGGTSAHSRRERRAQTYADSIQAVSEYLEGPYRVARCHNNASERAAISTDMSSVQSRIDAHSVLLRLHATEAVADTYDSYVRAARIEAGQQMAVEWNNLPAKRHRDMNLNQPLDRNATSAERKKVLEAMEGDLGRRWWKVWRWFRR